MTDGSRQNWAGTHVIAGDRIHEPRSLEELRDRIVARGPLRILGTGHTFNELPDSRGDLISLAAMPRQLEIGDGPTVTIDGGVRYGEICGRLDEAGLALEAMASLPHISVAGACATGTHGSGDATASLPAAVSEMGIMTSSGARMTVARATHPDEFDGLVVSLGAVGAVTSLTLDVVPRFDVRQQVYERLSLDRVLGHFDDLTSMATSVSLFTTWQDRSFHQVWCKQRMDREGGRLPATLFEARPADGPRHPIPGHSPDACTTQLGVPGPWHERLPHFRLDHTPSSGHELQSEYLVDRADGPAAIDALFRVAGRFAGLVQVSEVRTVAADGLWLSPAYGRASVAVHFTWEPDAAAVARALPIVEDALAPFDPRPHWGKLWSIPWQRVRRAYPRLEDFAALCGRWDPDGVFRNGYLDALLGGPTGTR